MHVHIHANCQSIPFSELLREVQPSWRVTWFEVHGGEIVEQLDEYQRYIRTADAIISQPIHDGYRQIDKLSLSWIREHKLPSCELIVVPSLHFSGHHPELAGLNLTGVPHILSLIAAHLAAIGYDNNKALEILLSDDLLSDSVIEHEISQSISETRRREIDDGMDVRVSDYLQKNCDKKVLFHIQNHPLRPIAAFVMNAVLVRLGLSERIGETGADYQPFTHFPPNPAILAYLHRRNGGHEGPSSGLHYLLPGYPDMTAPEFYRLTLERLASFSATEIIDAMASAQPEISFLGRLARAGSHIPELEMWSAFK